MLHTKDPPQNKRPTQTDSEGLEKILQANGQGKTAGVAILISDKTDFKTKACNQDYYIHKCSQLKWKAK